MRAADTRPSLGSDAAPGRQEGMAGAPRRRTEGQPMTTARSRGDSVSVTGRLLALGPARGDRPALVSGGPRGPGWRLTYQGFAAHVAAAAAGLARHGLRPAEVVGVHAPDAACHALAVHAVRAAGGVPCPIAPGSTVAAMAGQLADAGARMVLTAPPLAEAATAAAERSRVRQVISFGEAPGATAFASLLRGEPRPPASAAEHDIALLAYARGRDGRRHPVTVTHRDLRTELSRLMASSGVTERDVVAAAPPAGDGRAYTALLDLTLVAGATLVAADGAGVGAAAWAHGATAAIAPCENAEGVSLRALPAVA